MKRLIPSKFIKNLQNKYSILSIVFYGGLVIKAIDALIELMGGILLMILSHDLLNRLIQFIALPELREDPKDIIMNYFVRLGQNLSLSSQHSVAIYMLLHGAVKLVVVYLLLKKIVWAYPPSAVVFGLFISYEIYSLIHSPTVPLLLFSIIDIAMVIMIILEYKRMKTEKQNKDLLQCKPRK